MPAGTDAFLENPALTIDWSLSPAAAWTLLGVLLILAEFVVPGVIVMFFGAAAIIVGGLLLVGMPLSLNVQIMLFGIIAILLLLLARKRVQAWFVGRSEHAGDGVEAMQAGASVTAMQPFDDRRGVVSYRGARWNAELLPGEPVGVEAGQRLWIVGRHGLVLQVSHRAPEGADEAATR